MKVLFIGGTGLISSACSELAVRNGHALFILNRSASRKHPLPPAATLLKADIYVDETQLASLWAYQRFDVVVDWIAYTVEDIERDIRLFSGKTGQFIFISSASAYQKPPKHYVITEDTPLKNPYWKYSQDKIACEQRLMQEYHDNGFPVTIIRPSLTYGPSQVPLIGASWAHSYTVVDRMKRGQKVVVPGDGTSLWVLTWNGDFAKGLVGLMGNGTTIGEAFHITSDEVLSWDQIFLEVYQALRAKPNMVHISSELIVAYDPDKIGSLVGDKIHSVVFDNSKIKRFVPDFRCEVNWAEGVRRSLAWFESHPEFQTIEDAMNSKWDQILAAFEHSLP